MKTSQTLATLAVVTTLAACQDMPTAVQQFGNSLSQLKPASPVSAPYKATPAVPSAAYLALRDRSSEDFQIVNDFTTKSQFKSYLAAGLGIQANAVSTDTSGRGVTFQDSPGQPEIVRVAFPIFLPHDAVAAHDLAVERLVETWTKFVLSHPDRCVMTISAKEATDADWMKSIVLKTSAGDQKLEIRTVANAGGKDALGFLPAGALRR